MPRGSWADSYGPESCRLDPGYRRTWRVHVDRSRNNVYAAACRSSSRAPPWGGKFSSTATLPLHIAAEEAWMSIKPLHRIAARVRFWLNVKSFGWAANGDWMR